MEQVVVSALGKERTRTLGSSRDKTEVGGCLQETLCAEIEMKFNINHKLVSRNKLKHQLLLNVSQDCSVLDQKF